MAEPAAFLVGPVHQLERRVGDDAEVVEAAHDLQPARSRRARRRICRRSAGCRDGCRTAPAGGSGRAPRGGRTCCRWRRPAPPGPAASHSVRKWSRPWRSTSVSVSRRTPPFGVAPIRAMSIRLSHSRTPSIRWLVCCTSMGRSSPLQRRHLARGGASCKRVAHAHRSACLGAGCCSPAASWSISAPWRAGSAGARRRRAEADLAEASLPPLPLVTIRFDQPDADYTRGAGRGGAGGAGSRKPNAVFDVVTPVPTAAPRRRAGRHRAAGRRRRRAVADALATAGVPPEQIQLGLRRRSRGIRRARCACMCAEAPGSRPGRPARRKRNRSGAGAPARIQ